MFTSNAGDTTFFLHIPKTAGISLRALLEQRFAHKEICPFDSYYELQSMADPAAFLRQYRFVRGHLEYHQVRALLDREPITLTMLRQPSERLVSQWAFLQELELNEHMIPPYRAHASYVKQLSLADYVAELADNHPGKRPAGMANAQTAMIGVLNRNRQVDPQTGRPSYIREPTESDLERAQQRLQSFAWVGLTERYQDSLALLAYRFGLWPVRTISHLNVTARRPQIEQLAPELRDQLIACTQLDQRLYAYTQMLFQERYQAMCLDLLERYGRREHAHLPLPLAGDALLPLLDRHFADSMRARAKPFMGGTIGLDQPFEGEVWHGVEHTAAGEPYRWSGPERESQLIVPLTPGPAYRLSIRVVHALSLDTLHSLRITMNGAPAALQVATEPDGAARFTTMIPAAALSPEAPFVQLIFTVDQTVRPINGDDRMLGLAFGLMLIEPEEHDPRATEAE